MEGSAAAMMLGDLLQQEEAEALLVAIRAYFVNPEHPGQPKLIEEIDWDQMTFLQDVMGYLEEQFPDLEVDDDDESPPDLRLVG
jgi:hypothetical protein